MDFITELPVSEGCNQLWVIIDQFTKMAHFLPLRTEGKTAAHLAITFGQEVLSRISRGRLVSTVARVAVTLVALWLALITTATAPVILRA